MFCTFLFEFLEYLAFKTFFFSICRPCRIGFFKAFTNFYHSLYCIFVIYDNDILPIFFGVINDNQRCDFFNFSIGKFDTIHTKTSNCLYQALVVRNVFNIFLCNFRYFAFDGLSIM